LSTLLFPLLIVLLFVPIVMSGRKQKRQVSEMQQLQSSLADGDVVLTTSGLRATVVDASYEETIDLEIAPGVVTTWQRLAIRQKVDPTTPAEQHEALPHAESEADVRPAPVPPADAETPVSAPAGEASKPGTATEA
jgi:preprotein translocase subunit YajC